ncbi:T9SS type A sorting domain-containing protein [Persicobacter diffluens]|uniref:T9SS type A sorting domain-containing protein n=1 Tax=Persicobacter diffluens TaxID=981 RepID=A0AAN4VUG3_9BACT|nr:hypothetical protein PEDI_00760 [Persicobacter diffluens]
MKKMLLLAVTAIMMSGATFAAKDSEAKSSTHVDVIGNGYGRMYKVLYMSAPQDRVTMSIYDEDGRMVVKTSVKGKDGFLKPFRFEDMPAGEYTVVIKDDQGTYRKKFVHDPTEF